MPSIPRFFVLSALLLAVFAPPAAAQQLDLTGTWALQITVELEPVQVANEQDGVSLKQNGEACDYAGTVQATQDNSAWSGPAVLGLVSGPEECPSEMLGQMTGFVEQDGEIFFIDGSIDGDDPTGVASFSGTISPNPGGAGVFAVTQGPFEGADGTWLAQLQALSVLEIPVLTPVGLTLLALFVLGAGALVLRHSVSA